MAMDNRPSPAVQTCSECGIKYMLFDGDKPHKCLDPSSVWEMPELVLTRPPAPECQWMVDKFMVDPEAKNRLYAVYLHFDNYYDSPDTHILEGHIYYDKEKADKAAADLTASIKKRYIRYYVDPIWVQE